MMDIGPPYTVMVTHVCLTEGGSAAKARERDCPGRSADSAKSRWNRLRCHRAPPKGADGNVVQKRARFRHRSVRMIGREHDPLEADLHQRCKRSAGQEWRVGRAAMAKSRTAFDIRQIWLFTIMSIRFPGFLALAQLF